MSIMNILFPDLTAKHFIFLSNISNIFFPPAGLVASPGTAPEAAKPAQVTDIYINTHIGEDDVGFGTGPMCSVKQKHQTFVFQMSIVQNTILMLIHTIFPAVLPLCRCLSPGWSGWWLCTTLPGIQTVTCPFNKATAS